MILTNIKTIELRTWQTKFRGTIFIHIGVNRDDCILTDEVKNDKSFFDSLNTQFKNNGTLSDRQIGALKKMVARYADQIHNYNDKKDSLGLLEPRKPKEKKEVKEV